MSQPMIPAASARPRRWAAWRSLRLSALLAALAASTGCGHVGYERVRPEAPSADAPERPEVSPVIVVLMRGLRADVLRAHQEKLIEYDHVPPWPSGLALLTEYGFTAVQAPRAQAALPALGWGPLATLATGAWPGEHGLPASRFHAQQEHGQLLSYDFDQPAQAARLFYATGFGRPSAAEPTAQHALLAQPSYAQRAAAAGLKVISVFDPFGEGGQWWIPDRSAEGINGLVAHRIAAKAAPLLDRGARDAALAALRADADFDLLQLTFQGTQTAGDFGGALACRGRSSVFEAQSQALRQLDEHLWRILRNLSETQPERFARATFLLLSEGGIAERPEAPIQTLTAEALWAQLGDAAEPACGAILQRAAQQGELQLDGQGASALIGLRGQAQGLLGAQAALRQCLFAGLERLAQDPQGPLQAAAWRPDEGPTQSVIHPVAGQSPAALERLGQRLAFALEGPLGRQRVGAALAVLRSPWQFEAPTQATHFGRTGGLEDDNLKATFLLMSQRLSDEALWAMRSLQIEPVDLAPTVLRLLNVEPAAHHRPPLLQTDSEGWLVPVSADRTLRTAQAAAAPTFWQEGPDALRFGLQEPASLWPPDELTVRIGDQRFVWDVDEGDFEGASPCTYHEDDQARRWQCTLPTGQLSAGRHLIALSRDPSPEEGAPQGSTQQFAWLPVSLGASAAEEVSGAAEDANGAAEDANGTTEDANAAAEDANAAAEDANGTTEDANAAAEDANAAAEDANAAAEDTNAAAEDANAAAEDANAAVEDANAAAEDANGTTEDANVAAEDTDSVTEDANAAAEDTNAAAEDTNGAAEDAANTAQSAPHSGAHAATRPLQVAALAMVCADEAGVQVRLRAQDGIGLDQLSLAWVGPQELPADQAPERAALPALWSAHHSFAGERQGLSAPCAQDLMHAQCTLSPAPVTFDGVLTLPLSAAVVQHQQRAAQLPTAPAIDGPRLAQLATALGLPEAEPAPQQRVLVAQVCSLSGQCVRQALHSDRGWRERLKEGCP